jgi:hypothetical protein
LHRGPAGDTGVSLPGRRGRGAGGLAAFFLVLGLSFIKRIIPQGRRRISVVMTDYAFLFQRALTRRPLPGKLPVLDTCETRWLAAYSNSEPRVLMSNGEWRVSPGDVRPIFIHPRYLVTAPMP